MEITGYELFEVPPRWLFLKLTTDAGIAGWGEPILEGHTRTSIAATEELLDNYLIGKDPMEIERHWQAMYRNPHFRGGAVMMSALSGIDQALWDIKGKQYGVPVYELLGGRARDRIYTYQWIGGETPEELADSAEQAVADGYDALKMSLPVLRFVERPATVERIRERLAAVRERVGNEIEIGVDFRGRTSPAMAARFASALDPYSPAFYEEPVKSEHVDRLPEIASRTLTPITSGEQFYSRWDFEPVLEAGVDLVQPNPSHAGGISEVRRIATAAEMYDAGIAMHCSLGPISFASCLHLDITIQNLVYQSQHLDIHDTDENDRLAYLEDPTVFGFEDGYVTPPEGPGFGITMDEPYLREQADQEVSWQLPLWHHEDGSVANW